MSSSSVSNINFCRAKGCKNFAWHQEGDNLDKRPLCHEHRCPGVHHNFSDNCPNPVNPECEGYCKKCYTKLTYKCKVCGKTGDPNIVQGVCKKCLKI